MGELRKVDLFLLKILKKEIYFDFYVSKYDTYVIDRKEVDSTTKEAITLLRLDQNMYDSASKIVFLNKSEGTYYTNVIHRMNSCKEIYYLPLCSPFWGKAVLPFSKNKNDYMCLCWWGTYIPLHGLEKIIDAALLLRRSDIQFKLFIFGTSEKKSEKYIRQIIEKNIEDIVFINNKLNFADGTLYKFLIENCDVAFGNFGNSDKARVVMVNKVSEAASMGIPVISQKTMALSEYFIDQESIIFCDSTPDVISHTIIELYHDKEKMVKIGNKAYEVFDKEFSSIKYIDRIRDILAI